MSLMPSTDEMARMMGSVDEMKKEFIVVQKVEDLQYTMQCWENRKKQHWDNIFSLVNQLKEWSKEESFSLEKFEDFRETFTSLSLLGMFEFIVDMGNGCMNEVKMVKEAGAKELKKIVVEKKQLKTKVKDLEKTTMEQNHAILAIATQRNELNDKLNKVEKEKDDLINQLNVENTKRCKQKDSEIHELRSRLEEVLIKSEENEDLLEQKHADVVSLSQQLNKVKGSLNQLNAKCSTQATMIERLQDSTKTTKQQDDEFKRKIKQMSDRCETQAITIDNLKNDLSANDRNLKESTRIRDDLRKKNETLLQNIQELNGNIKLLQEKVRDLEERSCSAGTPRRTQSEYITRGPVQEDVSFSRPSMHPKQLLLEEEPIIVDRVTTIQEPSLDSVFGSRPSLSGSLLTDIDDFPPSGFGNSRLHRNSFIRRSNFGAF